MKKYKDFGVYDFSDYAEEITGEDLIKINGGATSCSNEAPPASPAPKESAPAQTTTPSGYNPGPTPQISPNIPEEIKSNPYAYAAYMAKQGQAKAEGEPDKYKGYNVLGSKSNMVMVGKEIQKQPLRQLSFGDRKAALIGAGYSIGIVINPNNLWDSGVKVSAEIGIGIEVGLPKKIGKGFSKVISSGNILSSTVDFSKPTSTCELEGFYNNAYVSAGVGGNFDIKNQSLQGLEVGNIGGGVYWGETKVYTAGEIVEGVVNTVAFIGNNFVLTPTMRRMTGGFKYIELDGQ